jgi:hypothetical protein
MFFFRQDEAQRLLGDNSTSVVFMKSVSEGVKAALLRSARALLCDPSYHSTSKNMFGIWIVATDILPQMSILALFPSRPCMQAWVAAPSAKPPPAIEFPHPASSTQLSVTRQQVPVLATSSGGPTESVLHGETGWLLPSDDGAAGGAGSSAGAAEEWSRVMAAAAADKAMCARMGKMGRWSRSSGARVMVATAITATITIITTTSLMNCCCNTRFPTEHASKNISRPCRSAPLSAAYLKTWAPSWTFPSDGQRLWASASLHRAQIKYFEYAMPAPSIESENMQWLLKLLLLTQVPRSRLAAYDSSDILRGNWLNRGESHYLIFYSQGGWSRGKQECERQMFSSNYNFSPFSTTLHLF